MVAFQESNPIRDGECLTLVGGPLNGQTRAVDFLFPFLNGGLPPSGVSFNIGSDRHWYELDQERRCWLYKGTA